MSSNGACGCSIRSGCRVGAPPGSVATQAVDDTPATDAARRSASRKYTQGKRPRFVAGTGFGTHVQRGENRMAETMSGAGLQRRTKALKEQGSRDQEHAAAGHLRDDQAGAQTAHCPGRPGTFTLKHRGRTIVPHLE